MRNKLHIASAEGEDRPAVLGFVGRNLRQFRAQAGLSQLALAGASGLSRRMIVALEAGDTNVSLSSLDRLAEALGVTFVDLVRDPDAHPLDLRTLAWQGRSPDSRATLLASVPAQRESQLWHWTLAPGERYTAEPDPQGWHEMLHISHGRLTLHLPDGVRHIPAGGHAAYSSAQAYAYANDTDEVTHFIRVVVS
ncbi:MAG: hypothetical protein RLY78_4102 [Pseudomonadota bacterium]|jgi:transcriptional regulator with XRE-family HTH domain